MVSFIRIISFIFFNIFICVNSEIINNPVKTDTQSNPINYYIGFTTNHFNFNPERSGHPQTETLSISEDDNLIKFDDKSYISSSNVFLCIDQNNKKYLYADYNLYSITQNNQGIITKMTYYKSIPNYCNYFGYIKENGFEQQYKIKGARCSIQSDEIILYGINNKKIIFYYTKENKTYDVSFEHIINNLSCKLLQKAFYLCGFDQNNQVNVIILGYFYQENEIKKLIMHSSIIQVSGISSHDNIFLYDTNKPDYKALCVMDKDNYNVECKIIYFDVSLHYNQFRKTLEIKNIVADYQNKIYIKVDNCSLTVFYSEFLSCCGEQDKISCQRKNMKFETVNKFNINLPGRIYNLTIENNTDYATLNYMNETENGNYLYQYYIYPPICKNYTDKINNLIKKELPLFEKKTNTKYFIQFIKLPMDLGTYSLNGEEITNINQNIEIERDKAIFSFISTKQEIEPFDILYNVSIEETYSAICHISFTNKPCVEPNNCNNDETTNDGYHSDINENFMKNCFEKCETCSKEGDSTNMNCLSCNNNLIEESAEYHLILDKKGNCIERCKQNDLFLTSEKECVESCPSGTYNFSYNYTCLKSCPHNYEIINNKCVMKSVDNSISSEEFQSQITENITKFVNSSKLINGSDFIAVISTSDDMDPKEQLEKGISAIDLGNCTQVIKDYYNISDNESLIIMNIESKKTNEKSSDNSFNLGKNN